jgi:hypothetical protein
VNPNEARKRRFFCDSSVKNIYIKQEITKKQESKVVGVLVIVDEDGKAKLEGMGMHLTIKNKK